MSEFKERERVEVRNHDDHEWVEATFVQKVVEILYCTQEPGRPALCWQQIRKIDPNPAENPIINPQTHA